MPGNVVSNESQRLKDTFFKMYHLMVKQTHKQLKHNELCSIKRNMQSVMEAEVCKGIIMLIAL